MKLTPQQKHIGRELVDASKQLAAAKRIATVGGPLATSIGAELQAAARRKIANLADLAVKYTPGIAKDEDSESMWSTLEVFGISRQQLPAILAALGASEGDIKEAVADPAAAYDLLTQFAIQRKPK